MKREPIQYKINNEDFCLPIASEPFISKFSRNSTKEFDRIQKIAEQTKGIVMPGLNTNIINVLKVEPHRFNSNKPLVEAQKWAEENLVGIYTAHKGTLNEFEYQISNKAIKKYIQSSHKSENTSIHISTLLVLPSIIERSIEVEIHADYSKVNGERSINNPIDKTVLIHRFYGAITIFDKIYRVKTTIKEYRNIHYYTKPYSFEVIKIELFDNLSNSPISVANHPNSLGGLIINAANILQNVEKSYDKGKFLLDESKKSIDYFRYSIL